MKFTFVKVDDRQLLQQLHSFFLPDADFTSEDYCDIISDVLDKTPDSVFVDCCITDDEKIVGFVVALIPPLRSFVLLHQVWFDKTFEDKSFLDRMFQRLLLWSETLAMIEIRAESNRVPISFLKKHGFAIYTHVFSRDINITDDESDGD